jgi:hypothetical protein
MGWQVCWRKPTLPYVVQPRWGWMLGRRRPRVGARASRQPWALLWNAFGVNARQRFSETGRRPVLRRTGLRPVSAAAGGGAGTANAKVPASVPSPVPRTPKAFAQQRAGLASLRAYPVSSVQCTTTPTGLHMTPMPAPSGATPSPSGLRFCVGQTQTGARVARATPGWRCRRSANGAAAWER